MSHLIFVYGTLKRGHGNNRLLANSQFIGNAVTIDHYTMFKRGIPFVNKDIPSYPIHGEVFEVDDQTLNELDALENHPRWYQRTPISVNIEGAEAPITAEIYFNPAVFETKLSEGKFECNKYEPCYVNQD